MFALHAGLGQHLFRGLVQGGEERHIGNDTHLYGTDAERHSIAGGRRVE